MIVIIFFLHLPLFPDRLGGGKEDGKRDALLQPLVQTGGVVGDR